MRTTRTKQSVLTLAASAAVLFTCLAVADSVHVPNSFQSGGTAYASEVNANFQEIEDVINGNLDGANIKNESLTSSDLASNSVGSSEIVDGSVGTSELSESVTFGKSGEAGFVSVANSSGVAKVQIGTAGCSGAYGGAIWVRQRGDNDYSAYMGVPACGSTDGGLVNVNNSSGAVGVQLQGSGNIYKTGNNGFVHPHPADPTQQIVYMSLEGPERGTYFRGAARLVNGEAVIVPPADWQYVTSDVAITVQVTPREECNGLYVAVASRDRVLVRELGGGTSSASFDYLVNGKRDGFVDHRVIEPNTMFLPTKPVWEGPLDSGNAPALIRNGILLPDGTVNRALVEAIRGENRDSILVPEPSDLDPSTVLESH